MKRAIFVVSFFLAMLLIGCRQGERPANNAEVEEEMEKIELTEMEEKILCELYIDEDRIREGKLFEYQKECLEQLRFVVNYLKEKYPDVEFEILTINPKSKLNMITRVTFKETGTTDRQYALVVEPDVDGWIARDDYSEE